MAKIKVENLEPSQDVKEHQENTIEEKTNSNLGAEDGINDISEREKLELDPLEDVDAKINGLEIQVSELNDKLLRAMAETENVRRRAQRDKEDASKYGIKNFAFKMIVIADNLRRGLDSVNSKDRENNAAFENIAVGIEMIERELLNVLTQFGIKPMEAIGEKFDPMMHEAMFEIEDAEAPVGTVSQVLEVGYLIYDRTLRAAKVGITKGGPLVSESKPEKNNEDTVTSGKKVVQDNGPYEEKGVEPGAKLDEEL